MSNRYYEIYLGEGIGNKFALIKLDKKNKDVFTSVKVQYLINKVISFGYLIDQLIFIKKDNLLDIYNLYFFNKDGSLARACGNGTRFACLWVYYFEKKKRKISFKINSSIIDTIFNTDDEIYLNLPDPNYKSLKKVDSFNTLFPTNHPSTFVNIGNYHLIIYPKSDSIDIDHWSYIIEKKVVNGINIGFLFFIDHSVFLLKVWERGSGFTESCGTGACAAHVSAYINKVTSSTSKIIQKGGELNISWRKGSNFGLWMNGSAKLYNNIIKIYQ